MSRISYLLREAMVNMGRNVVGIHNIQYRGVGRFQNKPSKRQDTFKFLITIGDKNIMDVFLIVLHTAKHGDYLLHVGIDSNRGHLGLHYAAGRILIKGEKALYMLCFFFGDMFKDLVGIFFR